MHQSVVKGFVELEVLEQGAITQVLEFGPREWSSMVWSVIVIVIVIVVIVIVIVISVIVVRLLLLRSPRCSLRIVWKFFSNEN